MQLVAVQMTLDLNDYLTEQAFRRKIASLMDQVVNEVDPTVPTLVAFPEDVGLMLVVLGLQKELRDVSTIVEAIEVATRRFVLPVSWLRLRHRIGWVPALFLHRHRAIARAYFSTFSDVARQYAVHIVAGSVVLPLYDMVGNQVAWHKRPVTMRPHNSSYVFGPDGSVLGRQDKVYLIDLEQDAALDLTPGDVNQIHAIPTELGKIGVAICLDAFQDDVIDALVADGAQILVQPSANPGLWDEEQQIDWVRSSYKCTYEDQRFSYAINPMMNGGFWDLAFFGQSSIVSSAPDHNKSLGYTDLTPLPGLLAVSKTDRTEEILVAKVAPLGDSD